MISLLILWELSLHPRMLITLLRSVLVYPEFEHNLTLLTWNQSGWWRWKKYTLCSMKHTLTLRTLRSPSAPPGQLTPRPGCPRSTHLSVWLACLSGIRGLTSSLTHEGRHQPWPSVQGRREAEGRVNEEMSNTTAIRGRNSLWPKPWVSFSTPRRPLQNHIAWVLLYLPIAFGIQGSICGVCFWSNAGNRNKSKKGFYTWEINFPGSHSPDLPGNQCKVPAHESWTISGRPLELEDTGHCSCEGNSELKIRVMGVWIILRWSLQSSQKQCQLNHSSHVTSWPAILWGKVFSSKVFSYFVIFFNLRI